MTHYKHEAKQAAHSKMERMGLHKEHSSKKHFDDVHPYDGVPQLSTETPSGLAPISKQRFKRGGKVAHLEGNKAKHNLGKKPRGKYKVDGFVPVTSPNHPMNKDISTRGITDQKGRYITDEEVRAGLDPYPNHPAPPQRPVPMPPTRPDGMKSGGVAAFNPALRKKRAAAMAIRKKKEGLPYGAPMAPGASMPSGIIAPHKKGGAVHRHEDVAADKKLIKSMVRGEALKHRAHKAGGGEMRSESTAFEKSRRANDEVAKREREELLDMQNKSSQKYFGNIEKMYNEHGPQPDPWKGQKHGGRIKKEGGGRTDEMCSGGRAKRATGGKVGKGKTSINIIISPEGPKGASQTPMGGPPAIPPQLLAAMAGGGAGGPPPGAGGPAPGAMLPGAGMAGAGGGLGAGPAMNVGRPGMTAPTPPMRKAGGRVGGKAPQAAMPVHQEHDYGSGSGLGRLEKRKWPLAK